MYAIIKTGGHQYRVQEGDTLTIDKIKGQEGEKLTLDQVLMLGGSKQTLGTPLVPQAKVEATIVRQFKSEKVLVFKYKRRKNYKRLRGHRQEHTMIKIDKIHA